MTAERERPGAALEAETAPSAVSRRARFVGALTRAWPVKQPRWKPFATKPGGWWPDVLLVLAFAAVTSLLLWPSPVVELDVAVRDYFLSHQPQWAYWVAQICTYLGQGSPLAFLVLCLSAWCAVKYRTIRPLLMYTVTYLTLGFVLGLKNWFDRVAPRFPDQLATVDANGSVLFSASEPATSYPSGHAANAVVWYALAVMLLGGAMTVSQRRLLYLAPPLLLVAGQTYLGYHWLSDAPAGFILGLLIVRLIRRLPWTTVPLGPLNCFEPASPGTVLGIGALLGGLLLAFIVPVYGFYFGCLLVLVGVVWLLLRQRRLRTR